MARSKGIDLLRAAAVFLILGRHMGAGAAAVFTVLGTRVAPVAANSSPAAFSLAHWISQIWMRGGWIGVDLFFVLSGFLVSGLLFREHQKFGAISAKNFLIRRGFKIYPAFWVLMGVTALIELLQHNFDLKPILSELLFTQNYGPWFWGHTWSLAVEEHFYFLLLLFLLFLSKRHFAADPFSSIPRAFLILAVVSLTLRIGVWSLVPFSPQTHIFPSHLRMDSLFCGVIISYYYYYHSVEFLKQTIRFRIPALVLGIGALVPAFVFPLETPFISTFGLTLTYLGSGLILIFILTVKVPENRFVTFTAYVGSHSYSIYLWHIPLALWGMPLLSRLLGRHFNLGIYCLSYFLGSIFFGIVMAWAIEFPLLKVRDRWFPSKARPLDVGMDLDNRPAPRRFPAEVMASPKSAPL